VTNAKLDAEILIKVPLLRLSPNVVLFFMN
jgi:hypothetical protein